MKYSAGGLIATATSLQPPARLDQTSRRGNSGIRQGIRIVAPFEEWSREPRECGCFWMGTEVTPAHAATFRIQSTITVRTAGTFRFVMGTLSLCLAGPTRNTSRACTLAVTRILEEPA